MRKRNKLSPGTEVGMFAAGGCLWVIFIMLLNIAFWGGVIWLGLTLLKHFGVI